METVLFELVRRSLPHLRALLHSAAHLADLVPDFFCSTALPLAAELGVPSYVFIPSNLTALAIMRRIVELHDGVPPGEHRDLPDPLELPGLNQIPDMRNKWRVISRVWVEMLCYAAVQCGGYQHAERLKEGGELITFVCLLMTHLGMGKHYRTDIGGTYAHLSPFTAQSASGPAPPAQAQGIQENATISRDEASTAGHGKQAATVSIDEASTSGHGHQ